jgi:putative heme-binding domain-containing protein
VRIRFQLAFSAGYLPHKMRDAVVVKLLLKDGVSSWFRTAVQSSIAEGASGVLVALLDDSDLRQSSHGADFATVLAKQIGRVNKPEEIRMTLAAVNRLSGDSAETAELAQSILASLLSNRDGAVSQLLKEAGGDVGAVVQRMTAAARKAAFDENKSTDERAAAIHILGNSSFVEEQENFAKLLQPQQPQAIQEATLAALSNVKEAGVAELLLSSWATFTPRLRSVAAEVLFSRTEWTTQLLDAVEQGDVARGDIDPARVDLLKAHPDKDLQKRAAKVFAGVSVAQRADVVAAYAEATKLPGDVSRGRLAFRKVCAACHQLEGVGTAVGADLKAIRERGLEAVLLNVLDPNREVKPQFLAYVISTADGQAITGMIAEETATSLTIRQPDGTPATISRIDIEEITSTGRSYMPEGLEQQLDVQAMADLLAYLNSIQ